MQALLPAARLHLARGDHDLARATAVRGLRVVRDDRLRAVELLTVLVDAELAPGDVAAAERLRRAHESHGRCPLVPPLQARAAAARARVLVATGDSRERVAALENAIDRVDASQLPWLHATLLLDLARPASRPATGVGAALDAKAAAAALATLDVVLAPADVALVERPEPGAPTGRPAARTAVLHPGRKMVGRVVRRNQRPAAGQQGPLLPRRAHRQPGAERHVLDLVDRVEGVAPAAGWTGGRSGMRGPRSTPTLARRIAGASRS